MLLAAEDLEALNVTGMPTPATYGPPASAFGSDSSVAFSLESSWVSPLDGFETCGTDVEGFSFWVGDFL